MKRMAVWFISALMILSCGGCTSLHVPLGQEDAQRITSTRLHAVVLNEEVTADVEKSKASTYAGGGLIPALIDLAVESHRAHAANDLLEPIRKGSTGFDFRKELAGSLQELKNGADTLKLSQCAVSPQPLGEEARKALLAGISENALLVLDVSYALTADFRALKVVNTARLWMKGTEEPVYVNVFAYHTPPVGDLDKDEAAAAWAANDAVLLRKALQEGAMETARMLSAEFSGKTQPVQSPTPQLWAIGMRKAFSSPSYLSKNGDRYIVRMEKGNILSLSSNDYLIAHKQ